MATLTKKRAKAIADTLLGAAMAPEVVVRVRDRVEGNTRFANGQPTTQGDVERLEISVTASIQGRSATVTSNRDDKDSLTALMAEAEELAVLSPENPEHVPPVGEARTLSVDGHDKATAKLGAKQRLTRVADAVKVAKDAGVEAAGFFQHHEESYAVATSAGGFQFWQGTEASLSVTCRTEDGSGSGRGSGVSHLAKAVEGGPIAAVAAEKADLSQSPKAIDTGRQLVILEAQAVADLLSFFVGSLDARAADEGRSFFARKDGGNRIGEELFHTSVNLRSNPADPDHPSRPFASDGQAHKVTQWVSDGVLRELTRSRYWAQQQKAQPVSAPGSLFMDGADVELLDLVRAVDRAVLVTRFWYNRMLEPRSILVTGLTRDGTFLVEQGKITTAVKNFRYNDSPVTMLSNVLALGRPQRVMSRGMVMVVPPMVVRDFNFSSLSDAV
ncbi:TldD protein [Plesiocystis pacifica SIR-1]|uniref:TldD protein n=1 Tax=Plesiocystis pacifica SIR-1 TaxID=391625 RepID=A6FWW8_9BACT|nr:metallopeptidase TldD-related protein [Plesiocystis pacifica]EDM81792.1 TldD protein [Plesiocystis pacifica SIR-1]